MRAELIRNLDRVQRSNQPFVLATVVAVEGSASARVGSKAIFDRDGHNLYGWVGGGCAESFVGDNAVAALGDRAPRTVLVDLDDEVFGLGIACGGRMRVFIEPHYPPESISLPRLSPRSLERELAFLLESIGLEPRFDAPEREASVLADLFAVAARAIAESRGRSFAPLRELKDLPVRFDRSPIRRVDRAVLIGQTRITEALARLFTQLGHETTLVAPTINEAALPSRVKCACMTERFDTIPFAADAVTIIGAHHANDPLFVRTALEAGSPYVGMIGSRKRAIEVLDGLPTASRADATLPLFVPAGLDIDARNPDEIALSVVAEVICAERGWPAA